MDLPRNCRIVRHIASLTLILVGAGCREAALAPDRGPHARTDRGSVAATLGEASQPRNDTDFRPDRYEASLGIADGDPVIDPLPIEEPTTIESQRLQAPVMRDLHSQIQGNDLVFTATFTPRIGGGRFFYDPERVGGWMLQMFLNTDQDPSGYWRGYDYIVRGGEKNPDGTYVIRQTMGGGGDGGWGAVSGAATLVAASSLELHVPLAALGGDDGYMDYALELYATVACPECPGGYTQVAVKDLFGTTGTPALAADMEPEVILARH